MLIVSSLGIALGLPTAITGILATAILSGRIKKNPIAVVKGVSWTVIPLVAGLFVVVEALNKTGTIQSLTSLMHLSIDQSPTATVWYSGIFSTFYCNLMNNLPAGIVAGNVLHIRDTPAMVRSAVLIGIDVAQIFP